LEERVVICVSEGVYEHALTRGKQYNIVNEDEDKFRIRGDHSRYIWINKSYFCFGQVEPLIMNSWNFDDDIERFDLIEVTITFMNGSRRWCLVTTPEKLSHYFMEDESRESISGSHIIIIMRSLNHELVERQFRFLDRQGELEERMKELL
jgi:hypothetical protein